MISHSAGDGLADPPRCIRGELEALGVIELLHRADESQVALLDQVQQGHSAAGVALGQGDHEAQVCFQQVGARCLAFASQDLQIALAGTGEGLSTV